MDRISVRVDPDLADLIPGFLKNRERDVQAIREAVGRGDFETVRIAGHSMKGAGGGYGFDAITDRGAEIERAAIARDAGAVLAGIAALQEYLQRVEVVYD